MTDTVIVYTDTMCIVYGAGIKTTPNYVFPCKMKCVSLYVKRIYYYYVCKIILNSDKFMKDFDSFPCIDINYI